MTYSKQNDYKNKPENNQDPNGEMLYRFHPQYGFVPLDSNNQNPNQSSSPNQNQNPSSNPNNNQAQEDLYNNPNLQGQTYEQAYGYGQGYHHNFGHPWAYGGYHQGGRGYGQNFHHPHMGTGYGQMHYGHQHMGFGYGQMPNGQMPYGHPHMAMQAQVDYLTQQLNQLGNFSASQNKGQNFNLDQMNEIYSTVDEVMNGKASPNKLFGLLQSISGDFWKGFAVGVGILLLYNYSPVKDMLASALGGLLGNLGGEQDFGNEFDESEEAVNNFDNSAK